MIQEEGSVSPLADRNKGTPKWEKIPGLPDIFFSLYFFYSPLARREERSFGTRLAGCRWYQKHFIVSVRARHIRGLPLADALSRRHVCFSVVKRAAGRQTGLNQPPPLSVSPLLPPLSLSLPILSSSTTRHFPSSFALHGRTVCTTRPVSQSDRVTNCFLFERTN